ncbi:MAG: hypothetical protein LBE21_10100 [Pseudomonadales bacterium]|jgi:hypothetical protein|nr:hypothetical protein [Pseudomonadales bacterium]
MNNMVEAIFSEHGAVAGLLLAGLVWMALRLERAMQGQKEALLDYTAALKRRVEIFERDLGRALERYDECARRNAELLARLAVFEAKEKGAGPA